MKLRPPKRGFRTAAGASIALAVLLCAWPSKADAGCSHYAAADTQPGRLAHQLDLFEHVGKLNVPSEPPARPKPCSGALCSGRPAVPVPVPIAVSRPVEAVIPRLPVSPAPPTTGRCLAYAERIVRAVIEKPSIDRPPR